MQGGVDLTLLAMAALEAIRRQMAEQEKKEKEAGHEVSAVFKA